MEPPIQSQTFVLIMDETASDEQLRYAIATPPSQDDPDSDGAAEILAQLDLTDDSGTS
jgi:hypothetical protein